MATTETRMSTTDDGGKTCKDEKENESMMASDGNDTKINKPDANLLVDVDGKAGVRQVHPRHGHDQHYLHPQPVRRANKDLSDSERGKKKLLKKHLCQRTKLRKYESRIQQAKFRNDQVAVETAMQEWKYYMSKLEDDPDSLLYHCKDLREIGNIVSSETSSSAIGTGDTKTADLLQPIEDRETQRVKDGREWIIKVYKALVPRIMVCGEGRGKKQDIEARNEKNKKAAEFRQQSTMQARELLANMQKGTQTAGMFNNDLALLGYTRQKFIERAVLAFKLLDQLDPCNSDTSKPGFCSSTDAESDVHMWEQLMRTNQIMSVGCGPGCDLVGVIGFFESHRGKTGVGREKMSISSSSSAPILLLDYVMQQWKRLVLDELTNILTSQNISDDIAMEQCDVRFPLLRQQHTVYQDVNEENASPFINELASKSITNFVNRPAAVGNRSNRLILVSYLLTETRHQWKDFFRDLLSLLVQERGEQQHSRNGVGKTACVSSPTTLLLLTEPTAWQLHDFLKMFGQEFIRSHVWLDSSRYLPHLQGLEARMGPASVLIALK